MTDHVMGSTLSRDGVLRSRDGGVRSTFTLTKRTCFITGSPRDSGTAVREAAPEAPPV